MRSYAGIGSRRTPAPVLGLFAQLASRLAERGYLLRSGHAPGADQAFERGAHRQAEVYLPWPTFEEEVDCAAGYVQRGPDGATTDAGRSTGGTGQALRIGAAHGIPVFNLARDEDLERVQIFVAPVS